MPWATLLENDAFQFNLSLILFCLHLMLIDSQIILMLFGCSGLCRLGNRKINIVFLGGGRGKMFPRRLKIEFYYISQNFCRSL